MNVGTKTRPAVKHTRPRGYIENYNPQAKTSALLEAVAAVLNEYREQWPLTVRQILYRLMGTINYPKSGSDRLLEHVANARRARLIPFHAIRDDGVSVIEPDHYADQDAFMARVRAMGADYTRDKLANQEHYVEVWCEAAGMQPQLSRVAAPFSIGVYSSGGYDSLTAKHGIAQRICATAKPAVILHLGDYDPSGESIFAALAEDVRAFVLADRRYATIDVEFRRIALTADQVRQFDLPTAPANSRDSRTHRWGDRGTCQLEALAPDQIAAILEASILDVIDDGQLTQDQQLEQWERQQIAYALPAGGVA